MVERIKVFFALITSTMADTPSGSTLGGLASLEKLDGRDNYNIWKFQMKMHLVHEGLWNCVEGYPADDQSTSDQRAKRDAKALAKIGLTLKPAAIAHVRQATSAKQAWENLEKAYEDKGLTRRLGLQRKLFSVKLEQYSSMEDYVSDVMCIAQKLADINAPIDDEFVGVIMLNGLPEEFNPMIMALESSGTAIASDFIKSNTI